VLRYVVDHPNQVALLALVNPMSPYGFGDTRDASGTPCWPDYAGSGEGPSTQSSLGRGPAQLCHADLRPPEARVDGAVQTILAQPFGRFLLTAAALGFVAFGVFATLQSRYRRM
jgi:hypothetical protein